MEFNQDLYDKVMRIFEETGPSNLETLPEADQLALATLFKELALACEEKFKSPNYLASVIAQAWCAGCEFAVTYWVPWKTR